MFLFGKKDNNDTSKMDKYKNIFFITLFIYIIIIGIFMYYFFKEYDDSIFTYLIFVSFPIIVFLCYINNKYVAIFKEVVIKETVKNKDLRYEPKEGITREEYALANFEPFNVLDSKDLVTGKINGLDFKMSNVTSYKRIKIRTRRNANSARINSFNGVVCFVENEIDTDCYLYLNIRDGIYITSKDKIKTNINEFDKKYRVYTDNKDIALKILTPTLTSKILDINKTIPMEIVFVNNYIYFRFFSKDLFKFNILSTKDNIEEINFYFYVIDEIKKIMNTIIKELKSIQKQNQDK